MPDLAVIVVPAIFGVVIVAVAAYYVIRFMRGSIKLTLLRTAFNPGEAIVGEFDLHTKKAIHGNRLFVSLICEQITTSYSNGERRRHSQVVYKDEVLLEGEKIYAAGSKATHSFEISTHNIGSQDFLNTEAGNTFTKALRFLSDRSKDLSWKVQARLDAKGVDLAASKSITINI